jgi:uncharacterized membrane protein YfcA
MDVSAVGMVLLVGTGVVAGGLGALVGIGGGIVVVPVLVIGLGYDIRTAVATSLVAVVATSAAAGVAYADSGLTNVRLGLALEVPTTIGGIAGGLVAVSVAPSAIAGLFSVVMIVVAVLMWRHLDTHALLPHDVKSQTMSSPIGPGLLRGTYFDRTTSRSVAYDPLRLGLGASISVIAGMLSGLLGVGGGFIKVPTMAMGMGVPVKAAAATSNFMVGITAIASLVIYFTRGYVQSIVVVPVSVGIVLGALIGSHATPRLSAVRVQRLLAMILLLVAIQMGLEALGGELYG